MSKLPNNAVGQELLSQSGRTGAWADRNSYTRGAQAMGSISAPGAWREMIQTNAIAAAGLYSLIRMLQATEYDIGAHNDCPERIVDFVRECLFERPLKKFSEYAETMLLGVPYGFAPHELTFKRDGALTYLFDMGYRPAQSITVNTVKLGDDGWVRCEQRFRNADGSINTAQYGAPGEPGRGALLWPVFGYSGSILGEGLMRPIWYLDQLKGKTLKTLGIAIDKALLGTPEIVIDPDATPTKAQLDGAENEYGDLITTAKGVVIRPGWIKEVNWETTDPDAIKRIIEVLAWADIQTLQAFSAQAMARGLLTGYGTNAAGEVDVAEQRNMRRYFLDWLVRRFQPLIDFLVDFNFGPQRYYPELQALYVEDLTPSEIITGAKTLHEIGALVLSDNDRAYFRNLLRMPEEQSMEKPVLPVPAPESQDTSTTVKAAGDIAMCSTGHQHSFAAGTRAPPKLGGQEPRTGPNGRPMSHIEKLVNWRKIEFTLDSSTQSLQGLLVDARRDMASALVKAAEATGAKTAGELADAVLDAKIPAPVKARAQRSILAELDHIATVGADTVQSEYEQQTNTELAFSAADDLAKASDTGAQRKSRAKQLTIEAVDDARAQLFQSTLQIIAPSKQAVLDLMKSASQELSEAGAAKSATLVSTEVFARARESHVQAIAADTGTQPSAVHYSAILDTNTCENCAAADALHGPGGEPIAWNSPEHVEYMPPYQRCLGGTRCRCTLVYSWGGYEMDLAAIPEGLG